MKRQFRHRVATGVLLATALSVGAQAGPALAASSSVSFAASKPFTPVTTGYDVTWSYGGGYNSVWVKGKTSSNVTSPQGAIADGLNSTSAAYNGASNGTITVTLKGIFTYNWTCTALYPAQATGGTSVIIGLYDVTAGRLVSNQTVRTWAMPECHTGNIAFPLTYSKFDQQSTGTVTMASTHAAKFSGSRIIAGHKYRVVGGIGASIATTAGLVTTSLEVRGSAFTATISY